LRQTAPNYPAFPPRLPAAASARYHDRGDPWPLYAALDEVTLWREWHASNPAATARERRRLGNVVVFPTGFDRLRVVRQRDLRPPG
jgi:hypothetical protein